MLKDVFITGAARTAIGSQGGSLSELPTPDLGAAVIQAALRRAGVAPHAVDEVILGNVLSAGLGQNPARQAALGAGLTPAVAATTVNKVCGSGLKAVMLAAQAVQCGDAGLIVAGGMENMSAAPYLLRRTPGPGSPEDAVPIDSLHCDGLQDAHLRVSMGALAEQCGAREGVSRAEQDDYAVASYRRAIEAQAQGCFAEEIVPIVRPGPGPGEATVFDCDEEPRRFNETKLRQLRPAFQPDGSITAANASAIADGAAALVVAGADRAAESGMAPQARILGYAESSGPPAAFPLAPVAAVQKLLRRLGLAVADVDLFEINEAFSLVPILAMRELGIPHDKVNVLGGAVALGHPIGASGARILVTLLTAMRRRGAKTGLAAACIGGGEAVAMAVERW